MYLPDGNYYNYWTNDLVKGKKEFWGCYWFWSDSDIY
jgi:alpha-glucosidase (family GH31 glycosyl hydrolase)